MSVVDNLKIHPTAIIEEGARIADGCEVGAYAYIGSQVSLGPNTKVHHHATVDGLTELGESNEIFPYATIGGKTHDIKYVGGNPGLKIGNHNIFRDYVSVHCATLDNTFTVIGDHNLLLSYSHVAHECQVGNHLIMSSHSALAGHAQIGNHVNIAWGTGVHQFCCVGDYAMVGACSKLVQDVPPFMIADGNPAQIRMINKVQLEREGFSKEDMRVVRMIYKKLYRSGLNRTQAFEALKQCDDSEHWMVNAIFNFAHKSERGFA